MPPLTATHVPQLPLNAPTPGRPSFLLNRDGIAHRIPHHQDMCLLDRVIAWDAQQIQCEADSHHSTGNPLRSHGRLGASCGIEYAAQAMALHGGLVAESPDSPIASRVTSPRGGSLVSLRRVTLHTEHLDEIVGPLTVCAERISRATGTVLYSFILRASAQLLLEGRAIVMLDAPAPSADQVFVAPAAT